MKKQLPAIRHVPVLAYAEGPYNLRKVGSSLDVLNPGTTYIRLSATKLGPDGIDLALIVRNVHTKEVLVFVIDWFMPPERFFIDQSGRPTKSIYIAPFTPDGDAPAASPVKIVDDLALVSDGPVALIGPPNELPSAS